MPAHPEHRRRARRALVMALLLTLLGAMLVGCGSSHTTGTGVDPAVAVPASAPLYAGAIVRPDGSLQAAASAAGSALTHQPDPYLNLLAILQTPGSAPLDFGRDIAPWLGARAGIFLSSASTSGQASVGQLFALLARGLLGSSSSAGAFPFAPSAGAGGTAPAGARGAIVLDTSDVAKARSFVESQAHKAGAHATSYRGVSYLLAADGLSFAVVDRLVVIGSQDAVQGVIDTTLGGPSLAQSADYKKLLAVAPSGALAHVFVNAPAAPPGGATPGATGSQGLGGLLGLLAGPRVTNVSLVPSAASISLDADSLSAGSASGSGGLLSSASQGAQAAGELPGDSWLAVGLGNVGRRSATTSRGCGSAVAGELAYGLR